MQPLYFGRTGKQLFGVYHPPRTRRAVDEAVLLCYPVVQEYMRTHWAFRKLAGLLVWEGFHVLRFDYYGTGDSAGEGHQVSVAQWCSDIRTAARELEDLAGVRRISLVGLRFGATLAAQAASEGLEVQDLVLWEPALDGRNHIRELETIHHLKYSGLRHPLVTGRGELLDHPFPEELRIGMERLDLRALSFCPADRILLFAGKARPEQAELRESLRDRDGRAVDCRIIPDESGDRQDGVLLSTRVLQAIATALNEGRG